MQTERIYFSDKVKNHLFNGEGFLYTLKIELFVTNVRELNHL